MCNSKLFKAWFKQFCLQYFLTLALGSLLCNTMGLGAKIYQCYMMLIWQYYPTWFHFVRFSLQYHRLMCNVIKATKPHVIDVCHLFWCPFFTSVSLWSWQIFLSKEDWDIACTLVSLNPAANHTWIDVFFCPRWNQ